MSMKTNRMYSWLAVVGLILFAMFLLFPTLNAKTPSYPNTVESETCAECHEDMAKVFLSTPHSANTCVACHDDPEKHLEEGGGPNIFAYTPDDFSNEKSKKCLTCHTRSNARYLASPHGKSSMDCTTCHVVHAEKTMPALLRTSPLKNCSTCHQDVFAQFQLNERHRLQEGILNCSTCHDPHEPSARERLGGFKHESCLACHTDKGGPFLYEHGASRIEGCTSCHEVHGSPNRHMLTHQNTADLCFSCHGVAPDWHSRFDSYSTNCTVCHVTIHGSNLSKIFLK
jgi:DmsE family decaheme c-type cytochrome